MRTNYLQRSMEHKAVKAEILEANVAPGVRVVVGRDADTDEITLSTECLVPYGPEHWQYGLQTSTRLVVPKNAVPGTVRLLTQQLSLEAVRQHPDRDLDYFPRVTV